jgi:hypothetical protein
LQQLKRSGIGSQSTIVRALMAIQLQYATSSQWSEIKDKVSKRAIIQSTLPERVRQSEGIRPFRCRYVSGDRLHWGQRAIRWSFSLNRSAFWVILRSVRVRITSQPSGLVDGVDLRQFVIGHVYDMSTSLATLLLVSQWAEPIADEEPALVVPLDSPYIERVLSSAGSPDTAHDRARRKHRRY